MAGVTKAAMVIAACEAGALGSLGAGMMEPSEIRAQLKTIAEGTKKPYNVNLFVLDENKISYEDSHLEWLKQAYERNNLEFKIPSKFAPVFKDQLNAVLDYNPPVVSFVFGFVSKEIIDDLHSRGILVIGTACNTEEAIEWERLGADAISAQGYEAGGHRGNITEEGSPGLGIFALIPEITEAVKIPVIAAGAIMDGKGILAAQTLGAAAVQLGTAFIMSPEAGIAEPYKQAICNAKSGSDTVLTRAFSGKHARSIRNAWVKETEKQDLIPMYPVTNALTQPLRKESAGRSSSDNMSLYVGQGLKKATKDSIQATIDRLIKEYKEARDEVRNDEWFN